MDDGMFKHTSGRYCRDPDDKEFSNHNHALVLQQTVKFYQDIMLDGMLACAPRHQEGSLVGAPHCAFFLAVLAY
ncbi:hypothetical protein SETIT_5G412500v2 [Setaria italica]|uniref:Uncharacterized protein n=1 Tax=Setaria italica TaxID=4555 RepID=A0A368REG1_SETIT|nr:hypothetical protein SETIT_5G412500v2 [Setaria italica]